MPLTTMPLTPRRWTYLKGLRPDGGRMAHLSKSYRPMNHPVTGVLIFVPNEGNTLNQNRNKDKAIARSVGSRHIGKAPRVSV